MHGRPWDDGEILAEALLVLDGGAETTRAVIAGNIAELARRPEQRRTLAASPELLGSTAVEEFIRWVTPISNMRRTALVDTELHGQQISAGDELLLLYGSANRDERVFDDPDDYDVTRANNHHVAFGFGTHFCLGASLARLELRVLFEELLRRFPRWRLVDPQPEIVPATFTRWLRRRPHGVLTPTRSNLWGQPGGKFPTMSVAPVGSVRPAKRPGPMAMGGRNTSAPRSVARATLSSQSATAKYTPQ